MKDQTSVVGLLLLFALAGYYCVLNVGFVGYVATLARASLCSDSETEAQMAACLRPSHQTQVDFYESGLTASSIPFCDDDAHNDRSLRCTDVIDGEMAIVKWGAFADTRTPTSEWYVVQYMLFGENEVDMLVNEGGNVLEIVPTD